jgi:hypothetical protein
MLPGMSFLSSAADAATSITQEPCCPEHEPCEKQDSKHPCGSAIGCALHCFNFAGTIAHDDVKPMVTASLAPVLSIDHHPSKTIAPPLPPPRL